MKSNSFRGVTSTGKAPFDQRVVIAQVGGGFDTFFVLIGIVHYSKLTTPARHPVAGTENNKRTTLYQRNVRNCHMLPRSPSLEATTMCRNTTEYAVGNVVHMQMPPNAHMQWSKNADKINCGQMWVPVVILHHYDTK